jgi:mannose-6-phosphate isomerase class I
MTQTSKLSQSALQQLLSNPLVLKPDNFTPPKRTPWGGTRIIDMKAHFGISVPRLQERFGLEKPEEVVVGESWEISGHPKFPNRFGPNYEYQLDVIGRQAPELLYGPANVKRFGKEAPFLTKLLNSGSWTAYRESLKGRIPDEALAGNNHELHMALTELGKKDPALAELHTEMLRCNLSIQIHPDAEYAQAHSTPEKPMHSKTEMWVILAAEKGAGLYLGLKPGVTKEQLHSTLIQDMDPTELLNFVEVQRGDIYFIPAGTWHGIPAGILMAEHQETSEDTARGYDWNRIDPKTGKPRETHFEWAIAATHFDAPRGAELISDLRRKPRIVQAGDGKTARHEVLANESEFSYDRVTFSGSQTHDGDASQGMHGLTITEGQLFELKKDGTRHGPFLTGQSLIIPPAMGAYGLMAPEGIAATVYIGRSDPR